MTCGCTAIIGAHDSRASVWAEAFGSRKVPLKGPGYIVLADFPGQLFYAGDVSWMTLPQKELLASKMSERFGVSRADVLRDLDGGLWPVHMENVTLVICNEHVGTIRR